MNSQLDPLSREYAQQLDREDPLALYREQFVIDDPNLCYLDGNSLGRLPKKTIEAVNSFLVNEWGKEVVTGWGHWVDDAQPAGDLIGSSTLGAGPGQVLVCDTTSVNFYQLCMAVVKAKPNRKTIITDAANFPTDRYILQGIAQQFGMKLVVIDNETDGSLERITPENLSLTSMMMSHWYFRVIQYRSGARNPIKKLPNLRESMARWSCGMPAILLVQSEWILMQTELISQSGVHINMEILAPGHPRGCM